MYSQHNEEEIILNFFGHSRKAVFLDIGAYDGVFISNTYQLWHNGWYGIYIEPSPKSFSQLQYNITQNRMLFNVAIVVDDSKFVKFYDNEENAEYVIDANNRHIIRGVSTTSKDHVDAWQYGRFREYHNCDKVEFSEIYAGACKLNDIIDALDQKIRDKIQFLDLDIEGTNIAIASTIPFDRLNNLKLICTEKDVSSCVDIPLYNEIFNPNGFNLLAETATNLFYAKS